VAHLVEDDVKPPRTQASKYQIRHLEELRTTFPQFFKSDSSDAS
jgi:pyrimidine and pyridine-specific 5'-nucleotidase